ncbi:right-handed parallel beta-helix repeat-containing protein [Chitinophaga caseinilytica]|uniref:Right-handed parallel beta-helix repeat-containing protein n=1 Tax=Chitinophaga caseinilytica TaxID=2267521 RepID=A0ABZ2Z7Y1_9BACT
MLCMVIKVHAQGGRKSVQLAQVLPAGYDKSGSKDYTKLIQEAMDKYDTVYFPAIPLRVSRQGLNVRSNQTLIFKKGSKLMLEPTNLPQYEILRVKDVRNVRLIGPNIVGDRKQHIGNGGEWGMGISILGSSNVYISGAVIRDCWGDGIYVSETLDKNYSENVTILSTLCDNNRRNGISVISVKNLLIRNSSFNNTNGARPMCGIDIEPNHSGNIVENVRLENIKTDNNGLWGIAICLDKTELINKHFKVHNQTTPVSVTILNHVDTRSESSLFLMTNAGGNAKASRNANFRKGDIKIINPDWQPKKTPINAENYAAGGAAVNISFGKSKSKLRSAAKGDIPAVLSNVSIR